MIFTDEAVHVTKSVHRAHNIIRCSVTDEERDVICSSMNDILTISTNKPDHVIGVTQSSSLWDDCLGIDILDRIHERQVGMKMIIMFDPFCDCGSFSVGIHQLASFDPINTNKPKIIDRELFSAKILRHVIQRSDEIDRIMFPNAPVSATELYIAAFLPESWSDFDLDTLVKLHRL